MDKLTELKKWSDPSEVAKIGKRYNLDVYVSTRKDKKYMVKIGSKVIHFGQMNYEDYTKHKDEKRRDAFRSRNAKWANSPMNSASWLSYYLLW